jgi:hypothetical protein
LTSSVSGGVCLWSAACYSVTIKALSNNSGHLYIGGSAAGQMPYSGVGFQLAAGEIITLDIPNTGYVKVCPTSSGDKVTWIAD